MDIDFHRESDQNTGIEVATPLGNPVSNVPHGDSFVFKDFYTHEAHIALLKKRGLYFKNIYEEARFSRLLTGVGYYRVSQFLKHFYVSRESKIFQAGTSAKQVMLAFRQNERLRAALIDALLKVEGKLKAALTEEMIRRTEDIYWCYSPAYADLALVDTAIRTRALGKSGRRVYTEQSTRSFFEQYPEHTRLPAWVVMQAQDFGTLCRLLRHKGLRKRVLKSLQAEFQLPQGYNYSALYNIFDALRHLRNLAVHHEKLLGEHIRIAPPLWMQLDAKQAHRLANHLFWLEHLLQSTTLRDSFSNEMREILKVVNTQCPSSMQILFYQPVEGNAFPNTPVEALVSDPIITPSQTGDTW